MINNLLLENINLRQINSIYRDTVRFDKIIDALLRVYFKGAVWIECTKYKIKHSNLESNK